MVFSKQLNYYKTELNVSQRELCGELYGVPQRTLQSWLKGEKEPPLYVQELILYKLSTLVDG